MKRLTDKEINCQYEMLMAYESLTVTREAALMLLDEVMLRRMEEREKKETGERTKIKINRLNCDCINISNTFTGVPMNIKEWLYLQA